MFQGTLFGGVKATRVKATKGPAPGQTRLAFRLDKAELSAYRGDMSLIFIDNVLSGCRALGIPERLLPSLVNLQACWNEGLNVEQTVLRSRPSPDHFVWQSYRTDWTPPVKPEWSGPLALPGPAAMLALPAPVKAKGRRTKPKTEKAPGKPAKASKAKGAQVIASGPSGTLERRPMNLIVASFKQPQDRDALRKQRVIFMATASYRSKGDWAERYGAPDEPRIVKLLTLMVGRKEQPRVNRVSKAEVIPMSALGLD